MARIKIVDLAENVEISKEEMKKVFGGLSLGVSGNVFNVPTVNLTRRELPNPMADLSKVCCAGDTSCACKC